MKQLASPLVVERPDEAKLNPAEGCYSRESGSPESVIPAQAGIQKVSSIPEFPLAQQEHPSRHKAPGLLLTQE